MDTGQKLYNRAKELIPGGTQLLTKRPERFLPDHWPSYYAKAKGAEVWDLDGNKYLDMSYNGVGSCILGHADPDVNAAVHAAIDAGSMSTLNCHEEVELAELLCEIHPWASMARYARSGGEAMAIAVRIARASTGREIVAFCGYHGWQDWYIAANLADDSALDGHLLPGLSPSGIPRGLKGTALPFHYNGADELRQIVEAHPGEIGAIVMEPVRFTDPEPGFLETVRKIADDIGAVLIFDEITIAFRHNTGGVHLLHGVEPDIAVFAKAISNGFPMSVILGRDSVMQAAQDTFISSTYWTERIGPTAALATVRKHRDQQVPIHLKAIGSLVQQGWKDAAAAADLEIQVSGIPALSHFEFEYPNVLAVRPLFIQMMLSKGFLASDVFYATYAHTNEQVDRYLTAVGDVFQQISKAIVRENVEAELWGPIAHTGFHRLT